MIQNHVPGMHWLRGQTVTTFGKDHTGLIEYNFNSQGFRGTKDFDFVPDYAFFGCSVVFGIGVAENKIFPYQFDQAHNYGLAGTYNNQDTMTIVEKFLLSEYYDPKTKLVMVWHSRDSSNLQQFYNNLISYNIVHFFCGDKLVEKHCYSFPKNLDFDVSTTHIGPATHDFCYKTLNSLFQYRSPR